jgi:hypothetical protein
MTTPDAIATAFAGDRRLAAGLLADVALAAQAALAGDPATPILVFDDASGRVIDLDLSGDAAAIAARYAAPTTAPDEPRGKGRPKLGVTAREVTLLPRHWEWLAAQPGGASATLRRLVEAARRADGDATDRRAAQEKAYRVMTALAGDRPDYEEATRALFAGDAERLAALMRSWPDDIRAYITVLASR